MLLMLYFCIKLKKVLIDDAGVIKNDEKVRKMGSKTALFEGVADPKRLSVKMSADSPYT
jgi:hypothetical protein